MFTLYWHEYAHACWLADMDEKQVRSAYIALAHRHGIVPTPDIAEQFVQFYGRQCLSMNRRLAQCDWQSL